MTTSQPESGLAGRHLGKYLLQRVLGTGNTATVYLARDPFMDRDVALKVARAEETGEEDAGRASRARFFHEAQTAGLLRHPNIVAIHDAGSEGSLCYIVMEYVADGRTLDGHTRPEHLLPLEQVTSILHQVALALDYAHRRGVVHRDIKPRNLLLNANMEVKIADFGVAVSASQAGQREQALIGSPLYMSPEQIRLETPTGQSDLFSLGIVAYQLLTGHHPFEARNLDAIQYRIQHTRPQPITAFRDDAPAIFQRILDKALARNPLYRYRTGADLAGDLLLVYEFLRHGARGPTGQEKFARLRALPFFAGFEDGELWELVHTGEWLLRDAGDALGGEGDGELSFFIVADGSVRVVKAGRPLIVLGAGECFGDTGVARHETHAATVVATAPAAILRVRGSVVERLSVGAQLKFQRNFLRILIGRLDAANLRSGESAERRDNT